jgi:N-acetylglucosaminyl-diphospho-decaprenol L-rhamnosyltransferase
LVESVACQALVLVRRALAMRIANHSAGGGREVPMQPGEVSARTAHDQPVAVLGPRDPLLDLSIVIINWNTQALLRACLTSIVQNTSSIRFEIIVVDNASCDGSTEMVTHEFPGVHLVANTRNVGFAAANNQGLVHARGHYLLLLNSDTIVLPGALEEMMRYMDAHPRVGALGPRLLNEDRSVQLSVYPFPHLVRDALVFLEVKSWPLVGNLARWYGDRRNARLSAQTGEVDWVMGACLMLRREVLDQVGLLDHGYFFGTEEIDLCYRLRQRGWSVAFLATAAIVHLGGQSWSTISATRLIWFYNARLRYYRLHHPWWEYLGLRAAIALAAMQHIIALLLRHQVSGPSRPLLAAYARVLTHAWRGDVGA